MSQIRVDSIRSESGTGAVNFPSGITVTGVVTATTLNQNISGVITATTFIGNVTGNVTGNATGLSGTPNVIVGVATATEFDISGSSNSFNASGISVGVITASSLSVGGRTVSTLGVGINTSGGNVGYGATLLDFRGSGISTVTVSSGIATINVAGGGAAFNPISFVLSL